MMRAKLRTKIKATDLRGMNKIEEEFAHYLTVQHAAGEVLWWAYECMKLRLADLTTYTPDFTVLYPDGSMEHIEIKATWSHGKAGWVSDARVKYKLARETFPMFWFSVYRKLPKKEGGGFVKVDL